MKKSNRSGFTLAEVLIALAIIGVIAAITVPSLLLNYQAKAVGVKLGKFATQLENAAIPYVAVNDLFVDNLDVSRFINKTYRIKTVSGTQNSKILSQLSPSGKGDSTTYTVGESKLASLLSPTSSVAVLNDGTTISVSMVAKTALDKHSDIVNVYKVGYPVFNVKFYPNVKGLASHAKKEYNYVVTDRGHVFPNGDDTCLWSIYHNNFVTDADTFAEGSVCTVKNGETSSAIFDRLLKTNSGQSAVSNIEANFSNKAY